MKLSEYLNVKQNGPLRKRSLSRTEIRLQKNKERIEYTQQRNYLEQKKHTRIVRNKSAGTFNQISKQLKQIKEKNQMDDNKSAAIDNKMEKYKKQIMISKTTLIKNSQIISQFDTNHQVLKKRIQKTIQNETHKLLYLKDLANNRNNLIKQKVEQVLNISVSNNWLARSIIQKKYPKMYNSNLQIEKQNITQKVTKQFIDQGIQTLNIVQQGCQTINFYQQQFIKTQFKSHPPVQNITNNSKISQQHKINKSKLNNDKFQQKKITKQYEQKIKVQKNKSFNDYDNSVEENNKIIYKNRKDQQQKIYESFNQSYSKKQQNRKNQQKINESLNKSRDKLNKVQIEQQVQVIYNSKQENFKQTKQKQEPQIKKLNKNLDISEILLKNSSSNDQIPKILKNTDQISFENIKQIPMTNKIQKYQEVKKQTKQNNKNKKIKSTKQFQTEKPLINPIKINYQEDQIQQINFSKIKEIRTQNFSKKQIPKQQNIIVYQTKKPLVTIQQKYSEIQEVEIQDKPKIILPQLTPDQKKTVQIFKTPLKNELLKSVPTNKNEVLRSTPTNKNQVPKSTPTNKNSIQKVQKNQKVQTNEKGNKQANLELTLNVLKDRLNMIGETIGHGSKQLKGIKNANWMLPCYFLYKKFYLLRKLFEINCIEKTKKKQLNPSFTNEIIQQNERVRISLQKMKSSCLKKYANIPAIQKRISQSIQIEGENDLDDFIEKYIQEVEKSEFNTQENKKILLHLLEMVNSVLIIQQFQNKKSKPMGSTQLFSEQTQNNLGSILQAKIKQMRKYR